MADSKNEWISLFYSAEDTFLLENLGKGLSANQFLSLLNEIFAFPHLHKKLSPILVGLPSSTFIESLYEMTPQNLKAVKQDSMGEPLLHQMFLFIHSVENLLEKWNGQYIEKIAYIKSLNPLFLTYEQLEQIEQGIEQLKDQPTQVLIAMQAALSILWNTNQIDLIDRLSGLKESVQRFIEKIGAALPPQGLFLVLNDHLNALFSSPEACGSLKDDDPSLEGLTRFSIWYLEDYWALGLLPSIQTAELLETEGSLRAKQALFHQVQQRLSQLGLETIQDLKKARIYSKEMLRSYLSRNVVA